MKLIYVHATQILAPSPGNTFIFFKSLAMAQLGHEMHLVCMKDQPGDVLPQILQQFGIESLPPNFHLHTFFKQGRGHFKFYRYAVSIFEKLWDPETYLWTRTMGFVPHILWSNRKRKAPVCYESHDCFFDLSLRDDIKVSRFKKHSFIERHLFKKLTGLLTLSSEMKKLYQQYIPGLPIHVTSGGAREIFEHQGSRQNSLIYVGSLDPHKGVGTLVPLIKALKGDFKFLIVGARNEEEKKQTEAFFADHQIGEKVEVHTWMDKASLNQLLAKSKFGLLPLKDTYFNRYLTSPLKCFDYMAHGLPVLTSDWPCLKDLIDEGGNGFFVNWAEPSLEQLKNIEELLQNDDQYNKVSESVYKKAEYFRWDQVALRQIEFFKTLSKA